jgi:putative ABC transport system substrate-binding protein
MYEFDFLVRDGGLMSYGPTFDDMIGRAADYVDKIVKSGKPGELPVEQPTRYYLLDKISRVRSESRQATDHDEPASRSSPPIPSI